MAKRWARIWFSFDLEEQQSVPRRLRELSAAADQVGFRFEAGRVQETEPEGEWRDQPDGSRAYGPPLGEAEP